MLVAIPFSLHRSPIDNGTIGIQISRSRDWRFKAGIRLTTVLESIAWINSTSSGGIVTVVILPALALGEWIEKNGSIELLGVLTQVVR